MRCRSVLGVGALIGLVNGLGIVALGLSPIVMTLAMNGILQGIALVYSGGTPDGFASACLALVHDRADRRCDARCAVPVIFVAGAAVLLGRTVFGRRVYAIGNGERPAQLSGVPVKATLIWVYHSLRAVLGSCRHPAVGFLRAGQSRHG